MRRRITRTMFLVAISVCLIYGVGRATYYNLIAPENNIVKQASEAGWTPDSGREPTLDEYLTYKHCGACVYDCTLHDPQCKRGIRLKKNATKEYNELYGDN